MAHMIRDHLKGDASAPVAGQPFMYGIMGPDGKAHFEEFCVSGDRDELQAEVVDHLNRDNPEDGPYTVVALFRDAAPQASAEDAQAPADVAQLVAFIFDRFGQPGDAGALPDNLAAAVRRLERGIKAQADKDGEACAKGDGNV
ncbi:hypothetical protein [Achromobacter xylosoxidans]|uniref:hypothetical protein n=1 Tax=Alcaligenes xylosoxydans xylosoxydans TaxID=85698 RepID=UPI0012DF95D1|nr:hypothetical protein [Achromobacter xylosoxidans]